ncbi:MAG: hypothetical protein LBJ00_01990 [Planctomycetaceae bacterium]|nr:hypothetical protein [Planctomycetaceae bacterium]
MLVMVYFKFQKVVIDSQRVALDNCDSAARGLFRGEAYRPCQLLCRCWFD